MSGFGNQRKLWERGKGVKIVSQRRKVERKGKRTYVKEGKKEVEGLKRGKQQDRKFPQIGIGFFMPWTWNISALSRKTSPGRENAVPSPVGRM